MKDCNTLDRGQEHNDLDDFPAALYATSDSAEIEPQNISLPHRKVVRKKVDPITGKPSTAENAIAYKTYYGKRTVDPVTGKPSTAADAISYSRYQNRKKVDPITGKPSTAIDAIPYNKYQNRKRKEVNSNQQSEAGAISTSKQSTRTKKRKQAKAAEAPIDTALLPVVNSQAIESEYNELTVDGLANLPNANRHSADNASQLDTSVNDSLDIDSIFDNFMKDCNTLDNGQEHNDHNDFWAALYETGESDDIEPQNLSLPHRKIVRKTVDPVTGKPSTAENAISYNAYYGRRTVDPVTGKPSTAENAIAYKTYYDRRTVDPVTGKPSTAENAIAYRTYYERRTVDPVTGKPSTAENAIAYRTYYERRTVDPVTGKPSTAENAIAYKTYYERRAVDPVTGKPSKAADAIAYRTYYERRTVDPVTGKPSKAADAIAYRTYISRKKVDPITGEPSTEDNAISRKTYNNRRKVDPITGEPSTEDNAIFYNTYYNRRKVDPVTGDLSTASDAISYSIYWNRKKKGQNLNEQTETGAIFSGNQRTRSKKRRQTETLPTEASVDAGLLAVVTDSDLAQECDELIADLLADLHNSRELDDFTSEQEISFNAPLAIEINLMEDFDSVASCNTQEQDCLDDFMAALHDTRDVTYSIPEQEISVPDLKNQLYSDQLVAMPDPVVIDVAEAEYATTQMPIYYAYPGVYTHRASPQLVTSGPSVDYNQFVIPSYGQSPVLDTSTPALIHAVNSPRATDVVDSILDSELSAVKRRNLDDDEQPRKLHKVTTALAAHGLFSSNSPKQNDLTTVENHCEGLLNLSNTGETSS